MMSVPSESSDTIEILVEHARSLVADVFYIEHIEHMCAGGHHQMFKMLTKDIKTYAVRVGMRPIPEVVESEFASIKYTKENTDMLAPDVVYFKDNVTVLKYVDVLNCAKLWCGWEMEHKKKIIQTLTLEVAKLYKAKNKIAGYGRLRLDKTDETSFYLNYKITLKEYLVKDLEKKYQRDPYDVYLKLVDKVYEHFSQIPPDESYILYHGDFDLQNILVDSDGRTKGIIDWDASKPFPQCIVYKDLPFLDTCENDPKYKKLCGLQEIYKDTIQPVIGGFKSPYFEQLDEINGFQFSKVWRLKIAEAPMTLTLNCSRYVNLLTSICIAIKVKHIMNS